MLLRAALSALLVLAAPATAADPFSWTIEEEPPTAPDSWMPGLWIAARPDGLLDALGRHAAIHEVGSPRLVVSLDRVLPAGAQAPRLDWKRATLERPGAAPLVLLDDPVAWKGQAAGVQTQANADATVVHVALPFALPEGPLERLTLTIPVADGEPAEAERGGSGAPRPDTGTSSEAVERRSRGTRAIVVRFATWVAVMKDAEKELADWRTHCVASAHISAIQPYLDCAAYRALRARGDTLLAALLLRELSREGARAGGTLPRFVILQALSDTEWGKSQQVPSSGDDVAAARVLRRWRELGHPAVPGANPHDER